MASKVPILTLSGGAKMPIIGLGAALNLNAPPGSVDVENSVETALEIGYRHFDTAYIYKTEQQIGNVIKRWIDDGKIKREDVFITTKLPPYGIHPDRVEYFIKKSLEALQLDYVDLYLIHHPVGMKYDKDTEEKTVDEWDVDTNTDHVAVWKKMEEQVDAGRAKAIGISNFNIPQIQRILDNSRIKPESLQVRLNAYHQQKKLVEFCHKNGITVVAYTPLGRPNDPQAPPGTPPLYILDDPVVKELAGKYSKTPAQILLRFITQRNIAAIPKSVSAHRQKENIEIFDLSLNEDDFKRLEELDKQGSGTEKPNRFISRFRQHPEYPVGI